MSRRRFTMDADRWAEVERYAKDTGRTTSGLVCEALYQIMARYPVKRNGHKLDGIDIDDLARRVAEHLKTGVSSQSK